MFIVFRKLDPVLTHHVSLYLIVNYITVYFYAYMIMKENIRRSSCRDLGGIIHQYLSTRHDRWDCAVRTTYTTCCTHTWSCMHFHCTLRYLLDIYGYIMYMRIYNGCTDTKRIHIYIYKVWMHKYLRMARRNRKRADRSLLARGRALYIICANETSAGHAL